MVERLKAAIEKARERRSGLETAGSETRTLTPMGPRSDRAAWAALREQALNERFLMSRRIVNVVRDPRTSQPFDLVRTRLLKVCSENRWRRIGVTSPTKGCGKTMLTANLAFSLARHVATYTMVLDIDLRAPSLAKVLGLSVDGLMADFLRGEIGYENILVRVSERLAFGVTMQATPGAAELLQDAAAEAALSRLITALEPTIVLYDLPPMLGSDDTLGFMDKLDAVLLVTAAGSTLTEQVEDAERMLASTSTPLAGVVLNKAEDEPAESYQYSYASS